MIRLLLTLFLLLAHAVQAQPYGKVYVTPSTLPASATILSATALPAGAKAHIPPPGENGAWGPCKGALVTATGVGYQPANACFVSRAGQGTFTDNTGTLRVGGINQSRPTYNASGTFLGVLAEEARTNYIRNNTMQGAVVGYPGTLPTYWTRGIGSGLSGAVVGKGTQAGVPYVDIRISGTATGSATPVHWMEVLETTSVANGQVWTETLYLAHAGGSMSGVNNIWLGWYVYNGTTYLQSQQIGSLSGVDGTLKRFGATGTISQATATNIKPYFFVHVLSGTTVDVTLRIGLPQLEFASTSSSVIPTSGSTVTRPADIYQLP